MSSLNCFLAFIAGDVGKTSDDISLTLVESCSHDHGKYYAGLGGLRHHQACMRCLNLQVSVIISIFVCAVGCLSVKYCQTVNYICIQFPVTGCKTLTGCFSLLSLQICCQTRRCTASYPMTPSPPCNRRPPCVLPSCRGSLLISVTLLLINSISRTPLATLK